MLKEGGEGAKNESLLPARSDQEIQKVILLQLITMDTIFHYLESFATGW